MTIHWYRRRNSRNTFPIRALKMSIFVEQPRYVRIPSGRAPFVLASSNGYGFLDLDICLRILDPICHIFEHSLSLLLFTILNLYDKDKSNVSPFNIRRYCFIAFLKMNLKISKSIDHAYQIIYSVKAEWTPI